MSPKLSKAQDFASSKQGMKRTYAPLGHVNIIGMISKPGTRENKFLRVTYKEVHNLLQEFLMYAGKKGYFFLSRIPASCSGCSNKCSKNKIDIPPWCPHIF